ncbi:MAG: hypothetical protein AB1467_01910 [Candidatus Diapherotrites archaeon]
MKKEDLKIFGFILIFTLMISLLTEMTSSTALYRDPWMFRQFDSANYILEKKVFPSENLLQNEKTILEKSFFGVGGTASYPYPVMLISSLSILSDLNTEFFINHSYFLLLILGLVYFALFRKLFERTELALIISVFAMFFPFEPLFYKITVHGWILIKIFGALSMLFLVFIIKDFEEKKMSLSKSAISFFFLFYFAWLSLQADKSTFLLCLVPILFFIIAYFFLNKKIYRQKTKTNIFVYAAVLFFLLLTLFYSITLIDLIDDIVNKVTLFHLEKLHFIPTFISSVLPYSEIYFTHNLSYQIIRYALPAFSIIILLLLTHKKLVKFISGNKIINSFILSQFFASVLIAAGLIFSLPYVSNRGAATIAWFLLMLSAISISAIKNKKTKTAGFLLFFFFVFLIPFYSYTQTLEYKYYKFNERQVSSIQWIGENLNNDVNLYSDLKMAKATASLTNIEVFNTPTELRGWAKHEIIPIFYDQNIESALINLKRGPVQYMILTNDMTETAFWAANQPLKPATALEKYNESKNFSKVFENSYVRIYKINYG